MQNTALHSDFNRLPPPPPKTIKLPKRAITGIPYKKGHFFSTQVCIISVVPTHISNPNLVGFRKEKKKYKNNFPPFVEDLRGTGVEGSGVPKMIGPLGLMTILNGVVWAGVGDCVPMMTGGTVLPWGH